MLIDTHCHLDTLNNVENVVKNFDGIIITSGYDDISNLKVLELVNKYDKVYGTLGIHPEQASKNYNLKIIEDNIKNDKIVGIGEIGLDYYYTTDNKIVQQNLLKRQLEIAVKYNKPVVIHSREAIYDTYNILKEYNLKGSIHCFSSSTEMALKFIKLGYKIGIGGVLTFKNGRKLQEVAKNISVNNIILETDSPYMAPEPFRGKENNPNNVYFVAIKLAEIKNCNVEDLLKNTNENALKLFNIK